MSGVLELRALVAEAVRLGGGDLCAAGHQWVTEGGRECPHADTPEECVNASQPVFRCARCGQWDYGEPGGPGAEACARPCGTRLCDTSEWREAEAEREAAALAAAEAAAAAEPTNEENPDA